MRDDHEVDGTLLQGAFDLHVHSYPDLMARSVNDLELARQAHERGMAGFVLKSHYAPTAERAWVVQEAVGGISVVGAVVLNHFVGGLNPLAVEALARAGGRVVFMPTSDAANEAHLLAEWDYTSRGDLPPYLQIKKELLERGRLPAPICLTEDQERVTKEALAVLEVVRDYELILATGHAGWNEIRAVVLAAKQMGIARVVVTHPDSPSINLDLEQQRFLVDLGAFLERCFAYLRTGEKMEAALAAIRHTGAERNVISSDLGAVGYPHPHVGLARFMTEAAAAGFTSRDIAKMVCENPAQLIR